MAGLLAWFVRDGDCSVNALMLDHKSEALFNVLL